MTIEEMTVQIVSGIIANSRCFEAFDYDSDHIKENIVSAAIEYAKEIKKQMSPFYEYEAEAEDVEYELIEE